MGCPLTLDEPHQPLVPQVALEGMGGARLGATLQPAVPVGMGVPRASEWFGVSVSPHVPGDSPWPGGPGDLRRGVEGGWWLGPAGGPS